MSAAIATPSVTLVDNTQRIEHVHGTISVSVSPATYTAGGVACSFSNLDQVKASASPTKVYVMSQKASGASGYVYAFIPGDSQDTGKLQVFTGSAAQSPLTELTDGSAIPAAVSGDTIVFEALFDRV